MPHIPIPGPCANAPVAHVAPGLYEGVEEVAAIEGGAAEVGAAARAACDLRVVSVQLPGAECEASCAASASGTRCCSAAADAEEAVFASVFVHLY